MKTDCYWEGKNGIETNQAVADKWVCFEQIIINGFRQDGEKERDYYAKVKEGWKERPQENI